VRSPKGVRLKTRMQLAAQRGISKAQIGVSVLLSDYNPGTPRRNICQSQVSFELDGYFWLGLKKPLDFTYSILLVRSPDSVPKLVSPKNSFWKKIRKIVIFGDMWELSPFCMTLKVYCKFEKFVITISYFWNLSSCLWLIIHIYKNCDRMGNSCDLSACARESAGSMNLIP